jgi:cell wall-associated NlpC family hydrolase
VAIAVQADVHSDIVHYAKQAASGVALPGWKGGAIPYSWGGGHGARAGPSTGTCVGYTGSIHPCPATHTVGVDCSGFSRWVYSLAFGKDKLGAGTAAHQATLGSRTNNPGPGDLVFFSNSAGAIVHVGVYIGEGKMINAPYTGAYVRQDTVSSGTHRIAGYYRYN